MDEHSWDDRVDHLEREGIALLDVVTSAATTAGRLSGPVRRIVDVGSGPGVGTCELARCFPDAHVVAVDSSEAMLARVAGRAGDLGFGDRVSTRASAVPADLIDLAPADIVFASMSLHHMPDPDDAVAALRRLLASHGLLIVIEHGPGHDRGHAPSVDARASLVANDFDIVGERVAEGRSVLIARQTPSGRSGEEAG